MPCTLTCDVVGNLVFTGVVVAHRWVIAGNSESMASNCVVGFCGSSEGLGDLAADAIFCTVNLVVVSERRCCRISTRRLCCCKNSAPRIALRTSAITNTQRKFWRWPRLRVRERVPYVRKVVLLTACSVRVLGKFLSRVKGGITLT